MTSGQNNDRFDALLGLHGPANRVVARIMRLYLGNRHVAVRFIARIELLIGGQGTLRRRQLGIADFAVRRAAHVANSFRGFDCRARNRYGAQQDRGELQQQLHWHF